MEPQGRWRPRVLQHEVGGQSPLGDILHVVVFGAGTCSPGWTPSAGPRLLVLDKIAAVQHLWSVGWQVMDLT